MIFNKLKLYNTAFLLLGGLSLALYPADQHNRPVIVGKEIFRPEPSTNTVLLPTTKTSLANTVLNLDLETACPLSLDTFSESLNGKPFTLVGLSISGEENNPRTLAPFGANALDEYILSSHTYPIMIPDENDQNEEEAQEHVNHDLCPSNNLPIQQIMYYLITQNNENQYKNAVIIASTTPTNEDMASETITQEDGTATRLIYEKGKTSWHYDDENTLQPNPFDETDITLDTDTTVLDLCKTNLSHENTIANYGAHAITAALYRKGKTDPSYFKAVENLATRNGFKDNTIQEYAGKAHYIMGDEEKSFDILEKLPPEQLRRNTNFQLTVLIANKLTNSALSGLSAADQQNLKQRLSNNIQRSQSYLKSKTSSGFFLPNNQIGHIENKLSWLNTISRDMQLPDNPSKHWTLRIRRCLFPDNETSSPAKKKAKIE